MIAGGACTILEGSVKVHGGSIAVARGSTAMLFIKYNHKYYYLCIP